MYSIRNEKTIIFEDLSINLVKGFAYQTLVNNTVNYNKDYFDKYVKMENTTIAKKLNTFRTSITKKYCKNY